MNFTYEVTHLDEVMAFSCLKQSSWMWQDGMPVRARKPRRVAEGFSSAEVERSAEQREVAVGQAMRGLASPEDVRSLAKEIVERLGALIERDPLYSMGMV